MSCSGGGVSIQSLNVRNRDVRVTVRAHKGGAAGQRGSGSAAAGRAVTVPRAQVSVVVFALARNSPFRVKMPEVLSISLIVGHSGNPAENRPEALKRCPAAPLPRCFLTQH